MHKGIRSSISAGMEVLLSLLWLVGRLGRMQASSCAGDCLGIRLAAPRGGVSPNALAWGASMVPLFSMCWAQLGWWGPAIRMHHPLGDMHGDRRTQGGAAVFFAHLNFVLLEHPGSRLVRPGRLVWGLWCRGRWLGTPVSSMLDQAPAGFACVAHMRSAVFAGRRRKRCWLPALHLKVCHW